MHIVKPRIASLCSLFIYTLYFYNWKHAIIPPISAAPTTHISPMQTAHTARSAAQAAVQVPAIKYATAPFTANKAAKYPTLAPILLVFKLAEICFSPSNPLFIFSSFI